LYDADLKFYFNSQKEKVTHTIDPNRDLTDIEKSLSG